MLTRWGHSSVVFNKKIYVFACRFNKDLNDLLFIDPQINTLNRMNQIGVRPIGRRRYSAGFEIFI
jgi:hypothetical protein